MVNQMQRMTILKKHAKNFVTKPRDHREFYECIHFDENNRGFVTDTHQAIVVEAVHSYPAPVSIHHKKGDVVAGVIPKIDGVLYHDSEMNITVFEDVHPDSAKECIMELIDYHKAAEIIASKVNELVKYSLNKNYKSVIAEDTDKVLLAAGKANRALLSVLLPVVQDVKGELEIYFHPRYMINVLSLIRDFKPTTLKICFKGPSAPIIVQTDVGVTAVIAPARPIGS